MTVYSPVLQLGLCSDEYEGQSPMKHTHLMEKTEGNFYSSASTVLICESSWLYTLIFDLNFTLKVIKDIVQ